MRRELALEVAALLQAGIWEKPPKEEDAIATFNGLLLNCVNSGLCEYQSHSAVLCDPSYLCLFSTCGLAVVESEA